MYWFLKCNETNFLKTSRTFFWLYLIFANGDSVNMDKDVIFQCWFIRCWTGYWELLYFAFIALYTISIIVYFAVFHLFLFSNYLLFIQLKHFRHCNFGSEENCWRKENTYNSNKLDTVPYQKFPVSIVNFTSILEITKKKIKNKIF